LLAPRGTAALDERLDLLPAECVIADERFVDEAVAPDHVQQREGEGGVAPGKRLQVQIGRSPRLAFGRDRRRTILRRRLRQPVLVCACGADADGLAPQTRMQAESRAVRGSKPTRDVP
jgi:hypothetical protein